MNADALVDEAYRLADRITAERDAALARLAAAETECLSYLNSGIDCDCEDDCDGELVVCFPHRILAVLVPEPAAEETRDE